MKHINTFGTFKINESENPNSHSYRMLSRLQSDCEYFLNHGRGSLRNLYYDTVEEHISEMKKLWNSLAEKPEWLSYEEIEQYEKAMFSYDNLPENYSLKDEVRKELRRLKYTDAEIDKKFKSEAKFLKQAAAQNQHYLKVAQQLR